MYTIDEVIQGLGPQPNVQPSPAPCYTGYHTRGVMLSVESMRQHMTDEGWQLSLALEYQGYTLAGHNCKLNLVDVNSILSLLSLRNQTPGVVVVQDKREWDVKPGNFRDRSAEFRNIVTLSTNPNLFKVTVVKDAQHEPTFHKQSADDIGCHAWIVYYHPRIVKHLAPYLRPQHVIRTYHTLDSMFIQEYNPHGRRGALLSGAVSGAYPLRKRLRDEVGNLPEVTVLPHPGYHRQGTATPQYLRTLAQYKVAICTASRYGYALRKIMEATASGCRVVTDLPIDEVIPGIDGNLIRIHPRTPTKVIGEVLREAYNEYDSDAQEYYAKQAMATFDYRRIGRTLFSDIEAQRRGYNGKL